MTYYRYIGIQPNTFNDLRSNRSKKEKEKVNFNVRKRPEWRKICFVYDKVESLLLVWHTQVEITSMHVNLSMKLSHFANQPLSHFTNTKCLENLFNLSKNRQQKSVRIFFSLHNPHTTCVRIVALETLHKQLNAVVIQRWYSCITTTTTKNSRKPLSSSFFSSLKRLLLVVRFINIFFHCPFLFLFKHFD